MSEHQPQHHHHDPARPVGSDPSVADPYLIDLVAGDPPVPVTVWRTARTPADAGHGIGARLAYRLVAAYSRPGDAVVDLTPEHRLAAVCARGRRSHHPAWFTDVSSLVVGPTTPPPSNIEPDGVDTGLPDSGEPPELGTWFGDDLTDTDMGPAGGDSATPADSGSLMAATSLVVACWPLDTADDATNRVRLAWLMAACARLLRPGGCLVLVVSMPPGTMATPEDFSPIATAAARVRLGYLQHIVAVAADTDADEFVYHATDEELLSLAHTGRGGEQFVVHLKVHADLLVFTAQVSASSGKPTGSRRGGRQGGGRRD